MREIKFRAWNITQEHMYYVGDDYGTTHPLDCCVYAKAYQPIILLQYTGQNDADDVEVYNGDIIDNWDYEEDAHASNYLGRTVVEWSDDYCGFIGFTGERFEVIGNIYENPELL